MSKIVSPTRTSPGEDQPMSSKEIDECIKMVDQDIIKQKQAIKILEGTKQAKNELIVELHAKRQELHLDLQAKRRIKEDLQKKPQLKEIVQSFEPQDKQRKKSARSEKAK